MNIRGKMLVLAIAVAATIAAGDDVKKTMIAVMPGTTGDKEVSLMPPQEPRACDWVAAWQTIREACPDAADIRIFLKERPGSSVTAADFYECTDIRARGQLLLITIRKKDHTQESVLIVPAGEVLRLEIVKRPNT